MWTQLRIKMNKLQEEVLIKLDYQLVLVFNLGIKAITDRMETHFYLKLNNKCNSVAIINKNSVSLTLKFITFLALRSEVSSLS